jgi:formiminoglutamase
MDMIETHRGTSPVILGFPHTGTHVPEAIAARLNERGLLLTDTDWHIHKLYAGLLPQASSVRARFHRYVIDANRDPSGASLYPGQNTTGLVPQTDFDGLPIWRKGAEPDAADIAGRLHQYHAPYHRALSEEIARVRAQHGVAILFDCHSIRSTIPFLFSGKLPDFNIGTADGASCAPAIEAAAAETARSATGYTSVVNGRFKGGWTTRYYGRPGENVHAIQLELAQDTHLASETVPFDLDPGKATRLRQPLREMLTRLETIAPTLAKARP